MQIKLRDAPIAANEWAWNLTMDGCGIQGMVPYEFRIRYVMN